MDYYLNPAETIGKKWWDLVESESIVRDQFFAFEVNDADYKLPDPEIIQIVPPEAILPVVDTGYSKVTNNGKEFKIHFTYGEFQIYEIMISVVEDMVVISCRHDIREEGKGKVSRKLERSYVIPDDCDKNSMNAIFGKEILVIQCNKVQNPQEPIKLSGSSKDL